MSTFAEKIDSDNAVSVSYWTGGHVASIGSQSLPEAPIITAADVAPILPGHDLWDVWPLQAPDGSVLAIAGGQCWMILSATQMDDPGMRHDVARTRMLLRRDGLWSDCGLLFPNDLNPGSREWSGAARYDADTNRITAYFTAAGT
jgi:levansucrase